jgi:S-adenosylmethionine:tRNA ribosyltransferase-isomerase
MRAADAPRAAAQQRLLHLDRATGAVHDLDMAMLPMLLHRRDLMVLNDAATLPASLPARTDSGEPLELRLAGERADGVWNAVLFGPGDWRQRTEDRKAPPLLAAGAILAFGPGLSARILAVSAVSPRLVEVRFDQEGASLWAALYRHGRPVQYSYLREPLALWSVQTPYASRPWAVEPPSAGRPLTASLTQALRAHGVLLATLTHAAGLSSTGDAALDARLPLTERYDIPAPTVAAVDDARRRGSRVIAVGTTVVRALEGAVTESGGTLRPGAGSTSLRLRAEYVPRIVDGVITGVHMPGESHYELLRAFAPEAALHAAADHAERMGYLTHEFGDSMAVI